MNASLNIGILLFGIAIFGLSMAQKGFRLHIRRLWGIDSEVSVSEQVLVSVLILVITGYVVSKL